MLVGGKMQDDYAAPVSAMPSGFNFQQLNLRDEFSIRPLHAALCYFCLLNTLHIARYLFDA